MTRSLVFCLGLTLFAACSSGSSPTSAPRVSPAVSSYFDPAHPGFFDFPWPSDARLLPGGNPDMARFPNPYEVDILDLYLESLETDVFGFGNNSPAYFRMDGPINVSRLPVTVRDGGGEDCPLLIVNIDPNSPQYLKKLPAQAYFFQEETSYNPPNLLAVAPAWGFPMSGGEAWAVVVLRELRGADGNLLTAPAGLTRLRGGAPTGDPALDDLVPLYDPLWVALAALGIDAERVAAATVFTPQDPVGDMYHIRQYLLEQPAPALDDLVYIPEEPQLEAKQEEEAFYEDRYGDKFSLRAPIRPYHLFEGHYQGLNFQAGEPPFTEEGGQIEFDAEGDPIVQYRENLRFALAVPKGDPPPGGWPLIFFAHGTGGDYKNFIYSSGYSQIDTLVSRGMAVMGIDEPLHGPRAPAGTDEDLSSFNFFNPDAARSNFRQAAIDVFQEVQFARNHLAISAALSPTGQAITFNPERMAFMGHSHGGLSGSLLLPFESDLRGVMLSGAGGGLSLTILYRKDYVDFEELFRTLLYMEDDEVLNTSHPVMGLVQTLVDITDPINYAPLFVHRPWPGENPRNYLQSEGFWDAATPPITTEVMVVAAGIPILAPMGRSIEGLDYLGIPVVSSPLQGNFGGGNVTAALTQYPEHGHSAMFRDVDGAELSGTFLQSAVSEEVPSLVWAK